MITYQDFEKATNKQDFIVKAIDLHKASDAYRWAVTAQSYYENDNEAIRLRMGYLERQFQRKVNIIFHKLRMGFFPKAVKRLVLYLMGNGADLDSETKLLIDTRPRRTRNPKKASKPKKTRKSLGSFDQKMIFGAICAAVDGVSYGFVDIQEIHFFRLTEFIAMADERTSEIKAGIRFWQIDPDKPVMVELYEIDGITEYDIDKGKVTEVKPKRAYQTTVQSDAVETRITGTQNYDVLPVIPLYANELKKSEMTKGLKSAIDAYDFIKSDLVDTITLIEGIYWIVKNFGGESLSHLLTELQTLKGTLIDGQDTGADSHTVEAPFQAKQMTLDKLEGDMYSDWLLPVDARQGGSRGVTATEIKDKREPLDMKADILEWQVAEFIEAVMDLKGIDGELGDYKRRTQGNDTEAINNISTQLAGAWITKAMAIMLDPTIPEEDKEQLIIDIALEDSGVPDDGLGVGEVSPQ